MIDRTYGHLAAGADAWERELLDGFDERGRSMNGRYVGAEIEEEAQLAQLAALAPRGDGGAEPPRPDPRHAAQDAPGVAIDLRQHLAGAVARDERGCAVRADVLDALEVRGDRVVAHRLEDPCTRGRELPAVASVAAPAAAHGERLALADVRQRTDEHDRLAVVADRIEDREVAGGVAPAHARDLRRQLARRRITRRGMLEGLCHPRSLAGPP